MQQQYPDETLTVVLPEFADAGALPAATWFGSWGLAGEQIGKVLFDELAQRRAGRANVTRRRTCAAGTRSYTWA